MKWLRFLLFPLSLLYGLITDIRNFLFDNGFLKSITFKVPVIVVGNLNVGGTGKTPQIEYLIRLLKDSYKIAVLSRGYRRKSKGFLLLRDSHSAAEVGDEPLQFFRKFKNITVAVDANRVNGIRQLLKNENPPEVILLDDAFQHRKVKAGFYILLTKYDDLYTDDYILPVGNLRESKKCSRRANIILVTKCPRNLNETERQKIIRKLLPISNRQIFFTTILYNGIIKGKAREISIENLKKQEFILVTGIANPIPLVTYLNDLKLSYKHLKYQDHHYFSKKDIAHIQSETDSNSPKKKLILTTEKDYMRLADKIENVFFININTHFIWGRETFDNEIVKFVDGNPKQY